MELFQENGCLTDEGLRALTAGQMDDLGRLEAAEHLSYCDRCMNRYTALLTEDALETPPRSIRRTVMSTIWIRLMQNTYGRAAVAGVAAVLALTLWRSDALGQTLNRTEELNAILPPAQTQPIKPERLGKPVETPRDKTFSDKVYQSLEKLLPGIYSTDHETT